MQSPVEPVIREGVAEGGVPGEGAPGPFDEAGRRAEEVAGPEAAKVAAVAEAEALEVPVAPLAALEKAATTS